MTFGIHNLVAIHRLHTGDKQFASGIFFRNYQNWSAWQRKAFDTLVWCHLAHALDFAVALICWLCLFPLTFAQAHQWTASWVTRVLLFNLVCELFVYSFWHWLTHSSLSPYARGVLREKKFNPTNPYDDGKQQHLLREVFLTTLGWLQSALLQCTFMWLWASGRLPFYTQFWSRPVFSVFILLVITYWREFHFYWVVGRDASHDRSVTVRSFRSIA
jgi:hypothetical protein